MIDLRLGDCLEVLKTLQDNSVDAVVTDPPYELSFMGKSWDNTGIAYRADLWREVLRVLKPGSHLLSFGGSRTYHRMACAIEDAGFEIRDQIMWVYGSGFPKSLNIGKQPNCKDWEGYGTALKPAHEPIVLARKPLSEKTVAENCLKWGVGGINIDGCRVGTGGDYTVHHAGSSGSETLNGNKDDKKESSKEYTTTTGRFPANLIHDGSDEVVDLFPNTGISRGGNAGVLNNKVFGKYNTEKNNNGCGFNDSGSASRFFYCAKASKRERDMGCEGLEEKNNRKLMGNANNTAENASKGFERFDTLPSKNNHPCVKPIALMKYLVKLISREGQTVLDPFMGSGTTGIACKELNRNFIGIEKEAEYLKIAEKRINRNEIEGMLK